MKFIHYSKKIITSLDDRDYDQNKFAWHSKPHGLWISVESNEGDEFFHYSWKQWCVDEEYRLEHVSKRHEIILRKDANVLHLKNSDEIIEFSEKYPNKGMDSIFPFKFSSNQLDWIKVKKEYQGIIISPYQFSCRMDERTYWYIGWDCSSGCLWDLSCIEKFIPLVD